MTVFELYLITTLAEWKNGLIALSLILAFAVLIVSLITAFDSDIAEKDKIPFGYKRFIPFALFFLLGALSPSYKQLALISSGSFLTQNLEAKQLPDKTMKVLNKFMDEYLEQDKSE